MALIERLKNPLIQQYIIEIAFPLIGYFFFDWSIFIIGIYYLIDHFSSEVLFFRRAYFVLKKGESQEQFPLWIAAIIVFLFFFTFEIIWLSYIFLETHPVVFNDLLEVFFIFAKEELWLLLPIVFFVYYVKDQLAFYMRREFVKYDFKGYVFWNLMENLTLVMFFVLGGYVWILTGFSDILALLTFVLIKIGFDVFIKRNFSKKALI